MNKDIKSIIERTSDDKATLHIVSPEKLLVSVWIDADDIDWVSKRKWTTKIGWNSNPLILSNDKDSITLQRYILRVHDIENIEGRTVKFKDGDMLDFRKEKLLFLTKEERKALKIENKKKKKTKDEIILELQQEIAKLKGQIK